MKTQQSKYSAKPVYYSLIDERAYRRKPTEVRNADLIYFPSTFEYLVYQELKTLVGEQRLHLQVPLKIKPATTIYPELVWHCDFRVYSKDNANYVNFEAKGDATREFKRNLQYLEFFSPDEFSRLMVVGKNNCQWLDSKVHTWTLSTALAYLREHDYA